LDAAITKLFKLDPAYAPIITANIDFVRKLNIAETAARLSGKSISIDAGKTFDTIRGLNNPPRQVVAHSPFDEAEDGDGVQFKRTIAKGELKTEDPLWTERQFEEHFNTLQRLEGELQQLVTELEPERIKWPEAAYLSPAFFWEHTPLPLRESVKGSR
jgi:hypothetical protein